MSSRPLRRRSKPSLAARIRVGWALALIGLLALGALGYGFVTAPQFRVTSVTVRNDGTVVGANNVLAHAAIADGTNLWLIHARSAAQRIETIPYVLQANVERHPPGSVVIVVTERVPSACLSGSAPVTIDANLRVLQAGCAKLDLVQIAASDRNVPPPGATVTDPGVAGLVHDAVALASAGVTLRSVGRDAYGGLVANDATGVTLLFGDDADLTAKAALVGPIRQAAKRALRTIDLRAAATPVVTYR